MGNTKRRGLVFQGFVKLQVGFMLHIYIMTWPVLKNHVDLLSTAFVNTCVLYVVVSVVIVEYHSRVFVGFVGCPM